jgi:integrase
MGVNLTEAAIKSAAKQAAASGARVDLSDPALTGLWLRLTPSGRRSWVLSCRDTLGATRRFPLGQHPAMGIAEARDAARAMREEVRKGADPIAEAQRKRVIGQQARQGVGTLTALLDLYGTKKGRELKTWDACRKAIEHVFAAHLAKPMSLVKLGDLQMTADAHKAEQSAAAAVRYLRPVLKWAAHAGRDYVSAGLTVITPPATVKRRERVLSPGELTRLLPALKASTRPHADAMLFMLFTLARREEVCGARWRDIDLVAGTWTIVETKNGRLHVVPLSRQAMALLCDALPRDCEGELVKPAGTNLLFATSSGKALGNWDREAKAIMQDSQTSGWTRHDLRRTGATMLGRGGVAPYIIEAALNHVAIHSTLAATYNQSDYRPEVKNALQALADELDGIVSSAAPAPDVCQVASLCALPSVDGGADVGGGERGQIVLE